MIRVVPFRRHILEHGVLDPEGVDHEFAYGNRGRKLDFDLISEHSPYPHIRPNDISQDVIVLEGGNLLRMSDLL